MFTNHITSLASHSVVHKPTTTTSDPVEMPSALDWKMTPWTAVDDLFRRRHRPGNDDGSWEKEVDEFFRQHLEDPAVVKNLPSLNAAASSCELVDGQLVRFRCMIQDMFDPEFYMSVYEVKDLSTGDVRMGSGKFRDIASCGPREEINYESVATKNGDRQTFYCVSIPGEAPWVTEGFRQLEPVAIAGCSNQQQRLKRNLEDEEEMETMEEASPLTAVTDNKKAKLESPRVSTNSGTQSTGILDLNLPIPCAKGKACIVKIYDSEAMFAVNECVEFVGIISLDPSLAAFPADEDQHDLFGQLNQQEMLAKSPPPSLVPRLHVLYHQKVLHSNPTLPQELPSAIVQAEAESCREELHAILTKALLGDSLSADYLICHLVAKIYLRRDVLTLGKFSLNLHNLPAPKAKFTKRLATLLQLLLTKSHYLPLSIENLNKQVFVPRKDYQANRLVSGLLQLSNHTHLILDETAMEEGELSTEGLKNLTALGNLINWQRVEYNFNYHQLEFNTDVPCLILSEGRSMLPCDSAIMLRPVETASTDPVGEQFAAIGAYLTVPLLERLRKYLTVVRHLTFEVTDEVTKAVQDDFVNERMAGAEKMTAEDLHGLLVLARLVALSHGCMTLTPEVWQKVKEMEKERKERVAHLPPRSARLERSSPAVTTSTQPVTANGHA